MECRLCVHYFKSCDTRLLLAKVDFAFPETMRTSSSVPRPSGWTFSVVLSRVCFHGICSRNVTPGWLDWLELSPLGSPPLQSIWRSAVMIKCVLWMLILSVVGFMSESHTSLTCCIVFNTHSAVLSAKIFKWCFGELSINVITQKWEGDNGKLIIWQTQNFLANQPLKWEMTIVL